MWVLPYPLHMIVALLAGVWGGRFGALFGLSQSYRDMNEIIVTILLNICHFHHSYFVHARSKNPAGTPKPPPWPNRPSCRCYGPAPGCMRLCAGAGDGSGGLPVAVSHHPGLPHQNGGANKDGARYAGIKTTSVMALTMALSGGWPGWPGRLSCWASISVD